MTPGEEIRDFVLAEFLPGTARDELTADDDLVAMGIVDSLNVYVVAAWLRERWDLTLDEAPLDIEDFRSVELIERFVAAHLVPSEPAR